MALDPVRVAIATDGDIVRARRSGRQLAEQLGCSATDATLIATAISEVARNIVAHAGVGEIVISVVTVQGQDAIEVLARDDGPGIADLARAMEDGYSTGPGLGLGLPGARRLMDQFEISSEVGVGTTVVMRKWLTS
ncbi:MAG: anti-sigma regulatory factor [Acidimicrobiales bacterium]